MRLSGNLPEKDVKSVVRLGDRSFTPADLTLRDTVGKVVPLRSQSAKVLTALIAGRGTIVSKDQLIETVWDKVAVTDDSLSQCITDIRKALNDTEHKILTTHARKGYFLTLESAAPPMNIKRIGAIAGALIAMVVIAVWIAFQPTINNQRSAIAVLAFDDLSAGPEQGFLSDAISEGIITELARFPEFDTMARNSSFSFRDAPRDVREIAEVLGVNLILEGSFQKNGEDLLVTAQLIDAATGTHVWAESYDETLGNLFDVQARIVRKVAVAVGGQITTYVPPQGSRSSVNAMALHAEGLSHMRTSTPEAIEASKPFFEEAIAAAPESPYGYLGMGFYHRYYATFATTPESKAMHLHDAIAMADNATRLAPDNYLTHYLRGRLYVQTGEMDLATVRFEKAAALNPSASNVLVGGSSAMLYVGKTEAAIADIRHAMEIDPLHPEWYHWQLGWALWQVKDCEGALASFQRQSVIPEPAYRMQSAIQACLGDVDGAKASMGKFMAFRPDATIRAERERDEDLWTARGALDRWIADLRLAGMPE